MKNEKLNYRYCMSLNNEVLNGEGNTHMNDCFYMGFFFLCFCCVFWGVWVFLLLFFNKDEINNRYRNL